MTNQGKVKAVVLAGTGALGMLYWKMACKDCDSIEDCDSTGVAIRKATSSVLWGMLYCTAIKVISDIAYKLILSRHLAQSKIWVFCFCSSHYNKERIFQK